MLGINIFNLMGLSLEILVKQHAEMSLFVKHVAATVDIACTASSHAVSVKAFWWRIREKNTRSDHVTRNALAARNNEAYGQGNGRELLCTVLRYSTREFCYWRF